MKILQIFKEKEASFTERMWFVLGEYQNMIWGESEDHILKTNLELGNEGPYESNKLKALYWVMCWAKNESQCVAELQL